MKLISSYHGITADDDFRIMRAQEAHHYDRASLSICEDGLSLKCVDSIHLASFLSSMVASTFHLSKTSRWKSPSKIICLVRGQGVRAFVYAFVRSFMRSSVPSIVRSFMRSLSRSFARTRE